MTGIQSVDLFRATRSLVQSGDQRTLPLGTIDPRMALRAVTLVCESVWKCPIPANEWGEGHPHC